MSKMHLKLTVNGKAEELMVEPRELLIHVLREKLNITGRILVAKPRIVGPALWI